MKKVLIDLLKLDNLFVGLGQVSLNYGKTIAEWALNNPNTFQFYFLVPQKFIGFFGNHINYKTTSDFSRYFSFSNSGFDLWHAIHQDSAYLPDHKTKYIVTIHDLNFMHEKAAAKANRRLNRLQKKVNRAAAVTCISNFAKAEVEAHLQLPQTCSVIYNGVQQLTYVDGTLPELIQLNKPFLFCICNISAKKNLHVLVPMMKYLPEMQLILAGNAEGEYAENLKAEINRSQLNNIKLIGKISDSEKAACMHQCAALAFPSLHEGFGLPVIEAMSCGKPVFLSSSSSLPEIAGAFGYYWNSFEPNEMATLINAQMEKERTNVELTFARQQYAKQFDWNHNVESYMRLYKQVLH